MTTTVETLAVRVGTLEDRQKEDRAEIKGVGEKLDEFRKESSDRSFTLVLFAIGQLLALIGGMGALLYRK